MDTTAKRGRPVIDDPLAKVRGIRFTEAEDELVKRAAERDGVKVASWIRRVSVAAAKRGETPVES